jgi:ribosomal protein S18 acetylase RimI-like enzyme
VGSDVLVLELAGGVATYTGPGSPMNKVAGLGFGGAVDEDDLAEVERAFAERGVPVQAEVATLADPSVGAMLTRRGYVLQGFENVLGRSLPIADPSEIGAGIEVSAGDEATFGTWFDLLVTGFSHPDTQGVPSHEEISREALEQPISDMAAGAGFHHYLAHRDGVLAGAAGLRVAAGVAQLCGAATLPAHRRRGVQSALLVSRLADAAAQGCDIAIVTTQPGSKSQQNVHRQGFSLLYSRAILLREA